jgi:hypothetical protein
MRRLNGPAAFFNRSSELLIGLGMLDAPAAQKCDQVFGRLLLGRNGNDPGDGPAGLDEQRSLSTRMDSLHQGGKTTRGVFNR